MLNEYVQLIMNFATNVFYLTFGIGLILFCGALVLGGLMWVVKEIKEIV